MNYRAVENVCITRCAGLCWMFHHQNGCYTKDHRHYEQKENLFWRVKLVHVLFSQYHEQKTTTSPQQGLPQEKEKPPCCWNNIMSFQLRHAGVMRGLRSGKETIMKGRIELRLHHILKKENQRIDAQNKQEEIRQAAITSSNRFVECRRTRGHHLHASTPYDLRCRCSGCKCDYWTAYFFDTSLTLIADSLLTDNLFNQPAKPFPSRREEKAAPILRRTIIKVCRI